MAVGEVLSQSAQQKRNNSKTPVNKKGTTAMKSSAGFGLNGDDK